METDERRGLSITLGHLKNFSRAQKFALAIVAVSIVVLLGAVTAPFWLPRTVRSLIPDRYIVAYAPKPFAEFVFTNSRRYDYPTVVPASNSVSDLLSQTPAPGSGGSQTPLPTVNSGGANQGTDSTQLAPGPTLSPSFISATDTPTPSSLPPSVLLQGVTRIWQGYNKCGPATLTMYLSYWGVPVEIQTQDEVANIVKHDPEDSNTSPWELGSYAESAGFSSIYRVDGDVDLLRKFIAAGIPVMIERGFVELPQDHWMGHYMLVVGYDDAARELIGWDSYWLTNHDHRDPNYPVEYWDYDKLDGLWRDFNRTYLVVYPPDRQANITAIIGDEMDDTIMYQHAADHARAELSENLTDPFGWFDLGSSLVGLGDYQHAAEAYDQWQAIGMEFRMMWYQFGPYEAYYRTGQYDKALSLANFTLDVGNYPESEEGWYYRGLIYQARGDMHNARVQFQAAVHYNPYYQPAIDALAALGQ